MARGRKSYVWNAERNHYLTEHANIMADGDLADNMTKFFGQKFSINAVRLQRRALGIRKKGGRGKFGIIGTTGTTGK